MQEYGDWHRVILHSDLDSTAALVAHTSAALLAEGEDTPSVTQLATSAHIGETSCRAALKRLINSGLLDITRKAGRGLSVNRCRYAFVPDRADEVDLRTYTGD